MGSYPGTNGAMNSDWTVRQRRELREFLRARRAALKPEEFGFGSSGRRRAAGLRREEVAWIAGIGLTWYTWLEQGRDIRVSEDILERLARALRLSPHDTAYLFSLAGRHPPQNRALTTEIDNGIQLVLDGFTVGPAFVINARIDMVASNRLARRIYEVDRGGGPFARNMLWSLFMDLRRRNLYVDWHDFAVFGVGMLRGTYASRIGNSKFDELLEALRGGSPEFEQMWSDSSRRGTSSLAPSEVRFRIPRQGILRFTSFRLSLPTFPDHFMVLLPPLDKKTSRVMAKMARKPSET